MTLGHRARSLLLAISVAVAVNIGAGVANAAVVPESGATPTVKLGQRLTKHFDFGSLPHRPTRMHRRLPRGYSVSRRRPPSRRKHARRFSQSAKDTRIRLSSAPNLRKPHARRGPR
jgi:hypothetical protein